MVQGLFGIFELLSVSRGERSRDFESFDDVSRYVKILRVDRVPELAPDFSNRLPPVPLLWYHHGPMGICAARPE